MPGTLHLFAQRHGVAFTPFLLNRERRVLRGHIAERNPQTELLDGRDVDVIFHGPHAYISPQLNDNDDVPTWNYVNVHVTGKAMRLVVQGVGGRLQHHYDRDWRPDEERATALVVIGAAGLDEAAIRAALGG